MDHDAASAPRFRFHQNVVIFLVAIPPTNVEAADLADRFFFRFRIPGPQTHQFFRVIFSDFVFSCQCHSCDGA